MAPPTDSFGDAQRELHASPMRLTLHDIWDEMHRLDRVKTDRLNSIEEKMDRFMEFTNGMGAKGDDGAVSRLNSHSKDIDEIKEDQQWQRRGLISGLVGLTLLAAGWGLSKVVEHEAKVNTQTTGGH